MTIASQIQAETYGADPVAVDIRQIDGSMITADWLSAMVMRGLGWIVQVGDLTTPVAGGGGTDVILAQQPELIIDIPKGWTLMPLRISVDAETPLIAADDNESEILMTVDRTQVNDVLSGTEVQEFPSNMRTDIVAGCPFLVASAVTANITAAPTRSFDLAHRTTVADVNGTAANTLWGDLWVLYEPDSPPFVVGPASLQVHWGGTVATSAYCQMAFLAIRSSLVTSLVA